MNWLKRFISQTFCIRHDWWPLPITGRERTGYAGAVCRECYKRCEMNSMDLPRLAHDVWWEARKEWDRHNKRAIKDMGQDLL